MQACHSRKACPRVGGEPESRNVLLKRAISEMKNLDAANFFDFLIVDQLLDGPLVADPAVVDNVAVIA